MYDIPQLPLVEQPKPFDEPYSSREVEFCFWSVQMDRRRSVGRVPPTMRPSFEALHENMICNKYRNSFYPIKFKELLLLYTDKWWNRLHAFISSVSSRKVLVMTFISPTAAIAIPVLLPDFRQTASYVSFVCSGNSIWWEHLLIQAGQAGAGWQHYSIMKVFTLLITRGNKVLSYGFDLATKCEWDVFFNMCKETIFYTNAPKSVMKLRYV